MNQDIFPPERRIWHTEAWNMVLMRRKILRLLELYETQGLTRENAWEFSGTLANLTGFELNREKFGVWPYMPLEAMEGARRLGYLAYPSDGEYPVERMRDFIERHAPIMLAATELVIGAAIRNGLLNDGQSLVPYETVRRSMDAEFRKDVRAGNLGHHGKGPEKAGGAGKDLAAPESAPGFA